MSLKFLLPIWQKEKAAGAEANEFATGLAEAIWCDFIKGPRSQPEDGAFIRSFGREQLSRETVARFGRALKAACLLAACKSAARRRGLDKKLAAVTHFAFGACVERDEEASLFLKRMVEWLGQERRRFHGSVTPMEEMFGHWVLLETLGREPTVGDRPLALLLGHRMCDQTAAWGLEPEQRAFFGCTERGTEPCDESSAAAQLPVRVAAEQGDPRAQFALGILLFYGRGVPKNIAEAEKWYRLAAQAGVAGAQSNLGLMYAQGNGVARDFNEAEKWFRRAAEQEHAFAQFGLGMLLEKGNGVPQNLSEAVKWYGKSADTGLALAQFALGAMYATGRGVTVNHDEAYRLYRLAAEQGHPKAQAALGIAYALGDKLPKDTGRAVTWLRKAAIQGESEAQFFLGMTYERGDGIPKDEVEALAWFGISATGGHRSAAQRRDEIQGRIGGAGTRLAIESQERIQQEIESAKRRDTELLA